MTATVGADPAGGAERLAASRPAEAGIRRSVHEAFLAEATAATGEPLPVGVRLGQLIHEMAPLLSRARHEALLSELIDDVTGLGPLEPLLERPDVSEVMVNGPDRVFVERSGSVERVPVEIDGAAILRVVDRVIGPLGLRLDRSSPVVDARLPDGSRLHAVIPPVAVDGPYVTIRRFAVRALPLAAFDPGAAGPFLVWAARAGWNLVVAGATSTGKTTFLDALAGEIPPAERIVTIEETAELALRQPHVVRLEARPANSEGAGAVTVRDLVRTALRMRPDRIVVGEVRGGEALDMVQALATGHDGSLSTVHAGSAAEALARIETLALLGSPVPVAALRGQIASSVDGIVHLARAAAGERVVSCVAEVVPNDRRLGAVPLFERSGGAVIATGRRPRRPARRPGAPSPAPEWFA